MPPGIRGDGMVAAQSRIAERLAGLRETADELLAAGPPDEETKRIIAGIDAIAEKHARDLLPLGAVGRLIIAGELDEAAALEDRAAYNAANPIAADRTVSIDLNAMRAREDAQAQILLNSGPVAVVILGGAHDLSESLSRASGGRAEYIRIETKAWQRIAGENDGR